MNGSCSNDFLWDVGIDGRGNRCLGPGNSWTCPKGCVQTGDPELDCRQLEKNRCTERPCDATLNRQVEEDIIFSERSGEPRNASLVPRDELPLVVKGSRVVGVSQKTYQLACVNWYGAHMEMLVNNGLNVKGLAEIAEYIVKLGAFNCVRLPYSLDSLTLNHTEIPHQFSALCHNPELQAASFLEIFDATVKALTDAGLLVVLNNHVFRRGWCCSFDDGEGLWYTEDFEESAWLQHLGFMAGRYKSNPRVVGFDIRNEIRSTEDITPEWGSGDEEKDWALAAAKGSRRVLEEDPDMLIIVSGLEYSMYLCRVPAFPLHMQPEFQSHIIYTSHEYDWYLSPPQFLQMRVLNASLFFLLAFLVSALGALAFSMRKQCCQAQLRLRRPQRCWRLVGCCTLKLQVVAAALCVALFYLSVFFLGNVLADPCGKSDFWAFIVFFLLWLPGFLLSMRLPWLLFSHLWPKEPEPCEDPKQVCEPNDSCERHGAILPCDDAEMAELNEGVTVERNAIEGELPIEVDELQPEGQCSSQTQTRKPVSRRTVFLFLLVMIFVLSINGAAILYFQSYEAWQHHLDDRWGFLLHESKEDQNDVAAVWLGEFGTAQETVWWAYIMRYMAERPLAGWAYWPLNGEKRPGEQESFGILEDDMRTIRHPWKLRDLQLLHQLSP